VNVTRPDGRLVALSTATSSPTKAGVPGAVTVCTCCLLVKMQLYLVTIMYTALFVSEYLTASKQKKIQTSNLSKAHETRESL